MEKSDFYAGFKDRLLKYNNKSSLDMFNSIIFFSQDFVIVFFLKLINVCTYILHFNSNSFATIGLSLVFLLSQKNISIYRKTMLGF